MRSEKVILLRHLVAFLAVSATAPSWIQSVQGLTFSPIEEITLGTEVTIDWTGQPSLGNVEQSVVLTKDGNALLTLCQGQITGSGQCSFKLEAEHQVLGSGYQLALQGMDGIALDYSAEFSIRAGDVQVESSSGDDEEEGEGEEEEKSEGEDQDEDEDEVEIEVIDDNDKDEDEDEDEVEVEDIDDNDKDEDEDEEAQGGKDDIDEEEEEEEEENTGYDEEEDNNNARNDDEDRGEGKHNKGNKKQHKHDHPKSGANNKELKNKKQQQHHLHDIQQQNDKKQPKQHKQDKQPKKTKQDKQPKQHKKTKQHKQKQCQQQKDGYYKQQADKLLKTFQQQQQQQNQHRFTIMSTGSREKRAKEAARLLEKNRRRRQMLLVARRHQYLGMREQALGLRRSINAVFDKLTPPMAHAAKPPKDQVVVSADNDHESNKDDNIGIGIHPVVGSDAYVELMPEHPIQKAAAGAVAGGMDEIDIELADEQEHHPVKKDTKNKMEKENEKKSKQAENRITEEKGEKAEDMKEETMRGAESNTWDKIWGGISTLGKTVGTSVADGLKMVKKVVVGGGAIAPEGEL